MTSFSSLLIVSGLNTGLSNGLGKHSHNSEFLSIEHSFRFFFFYCVLLFCLHVCLSRHVGSAQGGQKKALDPPGAVVTDGLLGGRISGISEPLQYGYGSSDTIQLQCNERSELLYHLYCLNLLASSSGLYLSWDFTDLKISAICKSIERKIQVFFFSKKT